jgi:predicted amidohydrolase YtcJ
MADLVLRDVVVDGLPVDVRASGGVVAAIGPGLAARAGDEDVGGRGGALIPGLHDHHIHLLALAAAARSALVGPPAVGDAAGLAAALGRAAAAVRPGEWVRAIGYHESVAGQLDRWKLDAIVADRPVRVQHRSGAAWVLNSLGLQRVGADGTVEGVELASDGMPTGRLVGLDGWLRDRLPAPPPPDLATVGRRLARYGVTGVTDATPVGAVDELVPIAEAAAAGELPQRVTVTGGPRLAGAEMPSPLGRGPVKVMVADYALPALDHLAGWMRRAHDAGRAVAVHCVTRPGLALALAAWDDAGAWAGDRIEHGSVVPPDLRAVVAERGLVVVTQPNFVRERGDRYLVEVEADDLPYLYPCRTLLDAGIPVGGGTDAPFGHPDPWRAIAAAIDRRTAGGATLGAAEAVPPERALALFLTPPGAPGGAPRRIEAGAPADLCLLDGPLDDVLANPSADRVAATVIGGRVVSAR